jgi:transcription initiation factor TFIIA small subunit
MRLENQCFYNAPVELHSNKPLKMSIHPYSIYRKSSIGLCLEDAVDELVESGKLPPALQKDIMAQFDKSINEALSNQTKNKILIKGHTHTYRVIDSVYLFLLDNASFKMITPRSDQPVELGHVKIIAGDASSVKETKKKKKKEL